MLGPPRIWATSPCGATVITWLIFGSSSPGAAASSLIAAAAGPEVTRVPRRRHAHRDRRQRRGHRNVVHQRPVRSDGDLLAADVERAHRDFSITSMFMPWGKCVRDADVLDHRVGRDRSAQAPELDVERAHRPRRRLERGADLARVGAALSGDRHLLNRHQRGVAKPHPRAPRGRPRARPRPAGHGARAGSGGACGRPAAPANRCVRGSAVRDPAAGLLAAPRRRSRSASPWASIGDQSPSLSKPSPLSTTNPSPPEGLTRRFDPDRTTPTPGRRETGGNGPS